MSVQGTAVIEIIENITDKDCQLTDRQIDRQTAKQTDKRDK